MSHDSTVNSNSLSLLLSVARSGRAALRAIIDDIRPSEERILVLQDKWSAVARSQVHRAASELSIPSSFQNHLVFSEMWTGIIEDLLRHSAKSIVEQLTRCAVVPSKDDILQLGANGRLAQLERALSTKILADLVQLAFVGQKAWEYLHCELRAILHENARLNRQSLNLPAHTDLSDILQSKLPVVLDVLIDDTKRISTDEGIVSFLVTCLANKCIDTQRRNHEDAWESGFSAVEAPTSAPGSQDKTAMLIQILEAMINELPDALDRGLYRLTKLNSSRTYTYTELGRLFGLPEHDIGARVRNAEKSLKQDAARRGLLS